MRRVVAGLLVLLATVVGPGMVGAVWLSSTVQARQGYVDLVAPLAEDPAVRTVLADQVSAGAVQAVSSFLPSVATGLLNELAATSARAVVESPTFPEFWRQANDDLHRQAIDVLEGRVSSSEGFLVVDARPLLAQVFLLLREAGLPIERLTAALPLDVPVIATSTVAQAGPDYRRVDTLSTWLPVLWGALVVLAVLVAIGWRGRVRTAAAALLGLALGSLLVRALAGPVGDELVQRAQVDRQGLAKIMADTVVESLRPHALHYALVAGVLGVVALVVAAVPWRGREDAVAR